MKAIILAAGMGQRLGQFTAERPKGMVELFGKPLLERQLDVIRSAGIDDIVIVKGYESEKIKFSGIRYYQNEIYDSSNMVHTLFCAENELEGEVLVLYSDILFEARLLKKMIQSSADVGVLVDSDFREYWVARNGFVNRDNESLCMDDLGYITEIGASEPSAEKMHARYIGMLRFSQHGIDNLRRLYNSERQRCQNSASVWYRSESFKKASMTDLIQYLIDSDVPVSAIQVKRGWLEVDSVADLELYNIWKKTGTLKRFFHLV